MNKHILVVFSLILIALAERLWFDLGPNLELVTWASVLAGVYLPLRFKLIVPLVIMAISDLSLGLTNISWFTWTGFGVMVFLPQVFRSLTTNKVISGSVTGISGVFIFYLWTNFGVWLVEPSGMYANDLSGLIRSYVNALPFLRPQLVSAVVFLPITLWVVEEVEQFKFVQRRSWRF